jgi:hypothetical protein
MFAEQVRHFRRLSCLRDVERRAAVARESVRLRSIVQQQLRDLVAPVVCGVVQQRRAGNVSLIDHAVGSIGVLGDPRPDLVQQTKAMAS